MSAHTRFTRVIEYAKCRTLFCADMEVYHISKLTKVTAGHLTDFMPGEAGAQVFKKASARV